MLISCILHAHINNKKSHSNKKKCFCYYAIMYVHSTNKYKKYNIDITRSDHRDMLVNLLISL